MIPKILSFLLLPTIVISANTASFGRTSETSKDALSPVGVMIENMAAESKSGTTTNEATPGESAAGETIGDTTGETTSNPSNEISTDETANGITGKSGKHHQRRSGRNKQRRETTASEEDKHFGKDHALLALKKPTVTTRSSSNQVDPQIVELRKIAIFQTLPPRALEVARDMKVTDLLQELAEAKAKVPDAKARLHDVFILSLRQELTENIMQAFLEGRLVASQLDDQIANANDSRSVLESKRDKAIRMNNIANFVSGGALAMFASGIQIGTPNKYQNAGNTVEVVAGGLSAGISAYALKIGKGKKIKAEQEPNMLAKVFKLSPKDDEQMYPDSIQAYMDDPSSENGPTRREVLIADWIKLGRIQSLTSKSGAQHVRILAGLGTGQETEGIDILQDRAAMLTDLRAAIMQMSKELLQLLQFTRRI